MFIAACVRSFSRPAIIGCMAAISLAASAAMADVTTDDPTDIPSIKWMGKTLEIPGATATSDAEMKPYTDKIPGTELTFDMVPIPGGTLTMGSPDDEESRRPDEGPRVKVAIEPFWMGKHEVTWDEYETWSFKLDIQRRKMKGEEPTPFDSIADALARPTSPYTDMTFGMGKGKKPAICMTQYAAKMYCKWLTAKTGRYYRLPTEAEWEWAARAGTDSAYSFGNDPDQLEEYAWYFDNSEDGYHEVGQKKPNPWGLYDMHGNVAEWVLDKHAENTYKSCTIDGKPAKGCSPLAIPSASEEFPRVVRGGSWDSDPEDCRSAARVASNPDWKMQDPQIPQSIWYLTDATFVGFRVVRPLRTPTEEEAKLYEPEPEIRAEYKKAQGGKE
jgi:formylglycine-generating enzyme required for sulfatase activity